MTITGELCTFWQVKGDNDTTEGRGGLHVVGWFETESEAKEAAQGQGVWGGAGYISSHQVFRQTLDNGKFAYWQLEKIELPLTAYEQAMAKLSPKDRKVLGLPDD